MNFFWARLTRPVSFLILAAFGHVSSISRVIPVSLHTGDLFVLFLGCIDEVLVDYADIKLAEADPDRGIPTSPPDTMTPYTKLLHVAWLLAYLCSLGSAIQIFVGTSTLGGARDTCEDIQEFSCINDTCDPYAGTDHNGRCRNGGNRDGTCPAATLCNEPGKDQCIENTISADGLHRMPTAKAKHFYCAAVTEFDKPAVMYEKQDCTGKACFIPGNGQYVPWSRGAQANCIVINPTVPANVPPCLAAGQNGLYPPQGGFPSDKTESVGGDYGLPAAFDNSLVCRPKYETFPPPISRDGYDPLAGDIKDQYISGITSTGGLDVSELDTRSWRGRIQPRVDGIVRTQALRDAYPYRATFLAVTNQVWWLMAANGGLLSWTASFTGDQATELGLNVDHVVELNQIVQFISQSWSQDLGIGQNAWITVQDFIRAAGRAARPAPDGDTSCAIFDEFAQYIGGLGNLRGVASRINTLKGLAFAAVLPDANVPNWRGGGILDGIEARAVATYLQQTSDQARIAAAAIGGAMDVIAGSTAQQAFANAFTKWVVGQWANAYFQMDGAAGP
ncbi:MAG: hypothetical protein Q9169_007217 [Polycauliona sp. 2 TL-2023]